MPFRWPSRSPVAGRPRAPPSPLGEARADISVLCRTPGAPIFPTRGARDADAALEVPTVRDRRSARSNVARSRPRRGPDLVLDRPSRWQPGARQPDGQRAQAEVLRALARARHTRDRGWLPRGVEDGFRLRPPPDRGRGRPERHDDRRADAGAAGSHRAQFRGDRRREAGDRPPLQLDLGHAAARRVPARPRRHHRARREGRTALPGARGRRRRRDQYSSIHPRASITPSSTTPSRSARQSQRSGGRPPTRR